MSTQGLLNCSFRKKKKNPTGMANWPTSATQNHGCIKAATMPAERSGKTEPGPSLSGAEAFAIRVTAAPSSWEAVNTTAT